jgi:phosphoribosylglycinamide formyltransferase 1
LKKIVVFASGSGTNFQAVIDSVHSGRIQAKIAGLITSKDDIGAIERAEKAGIPYYVLKRSHFKNENQFGEAILEKLKIWKPDLIVLAGYIVKLPSSVIQKYPDSIINIHPSLLPKYGGRGYYGSRVHQAVIDEGESESGCTVHYVNEVYDEGPVIAQKKIKVLPGDTPESLAKRILKEEHKLLPAVINQLLN